MKRFPFAAGALLLTSVSCASGGSTSAVARKPWGRSISVYESPGPGCPYTPLGEVRAVDPPGFEFLSVQEQAQRRGADAVINAVFDPTRGGRGYYVSGTAIRWADPDCP